MSVCDREGGIGNQIHHQHELADQVDFWSGATVPDNGSLYWKLSARRRYGSTWIRVVTSGCKIQNRQFQQTHALLKSMVLDAITAW